MHSSIVTCKLLFAPFLTLWILLSSALNLQASKSGLAVESTDSLAYYVEMAMNAGDANQQKQYTDKAVELARKGNNSNANLTPLLVLERYYADQSKLKMAKALAQEVITISKQENLDASAAMGLHRLATAYRYGGNYSSSIRYYNESLQLANMLGDTSLILENQTGLGTIYYVLGQYEQALALYQSCLTLSQQAKELSFQFSALTGCGLVYFALGDDEQALSSYDQALTISEAMDRPLYESIAYGNLADFYAKKQNDDLALVYVNRSLELAENENNKMGISQCLNQLGDLAVKSRQYRDALNYYHRSATLVTEANAQAELAYPLIQSGKAYRALGQLEEARQSLESGLQIAQSSGLKKEIKEAAETLSQLKQQTGDHKKALDYFILYKQMEDSLQIDQLRREIAQLEVQNQLKNEADSIQNANEIIRLALENDIEQRKANQKATWVGLILITLLAIVLYLFYRSQSKSNTVLKSQKLALEEANQSIQEKTELLSISNKELEASNTVKKKIFSIIAHDLKSPISNFQSILTLINGGSQPTPSEMEMILKELSEKVDGLSELIDNLLFWARGQMEGSLQLNPQQLEVKVQLKHIIRLYEQNAETKALSTEIQIENDVQASVYADAEIFKFVIRNLLTNAYKFSHHGGRVTLTVENLQTNQVRITVKDQGIGMDEETAKKLFKEFVYSRSGTKQEKGTGIGLMLCKDFVEISNGQIGVESKLGKGTRFWVLLPATS